MSKAPIAFFSYVHDDDTHDHGRLTRIRERLQGEISIQWGERVEIFQDRDMRWGTAWKERIENTLDATTFLIPVITPRYFASTPCRQELERFLEREAKLGRNDLILPLYYLKAPVLENADRRKADPLAEIVAGRQYVDWRSLRHEVEAAPDFGKALARAAEQIVESLHRNAAPPSPPPRPVPVTGTASDGLGKPASGGEETTGATAPGSAPTDPPTLVVDAMHRGDCPTISDAIQKAKAGTRILVRPGTYREGLVIDKALEIVGDGDRDDIVVEATGCHAVLFTASMGRVANLTIRQRGGGNFYGVDIAAGRLDLSECDIACDSLACIAIHDGADPRLRRNRIHDGGSGGIFVYENGRGTIEKNEISGNARAGIEIRTGADPVVRRNHIYDGKRDGIYVRQNGRGTVEDNLLQGNAGDGIFVSTEGAPMVRQNKISGNGGFGVRLVSGAAGTYEKNTLRENKLGAASPLVKSMPGIIWQNNDKI